MDKIPVGVVGATGLVGERYVKLLKGHPLFELTATASSKDSPAIMKGCKIVFSALPSFAAAEWEPILAEMGALVLSSAATFRLDADIPLVLPEINLDHFALLEKQRQERGWSGGIIAKPNCSLQSYLLPLFPLHQAFGLKSLLITTFQSISGAGAGFELSDNILPHIEGEEEKSEREPLKILGLPRLPISVHCNRVPVSIGHLATVSVAFEGKPTRKEILSLWKDFKPLSAGLPTAPDQTIIYHEEVDRPQPKLDRDQGEGMSVTTGRLRECPVLDFRFTALSHNVVRGGSGGGLCTAESYVERYG